MKKTQAATLILLFVFPLFLSACSLIPGTKKEETPISDERTPSRTTQEQPSKSKNDKAPLPISEVQDVDAVWNKYVNNEFGYELKFPKQAVSASGECTWMADQESYRPRNAFVPVAVFEDENVANIAFSYYYALTDEVRTEGVSSFGSCERTDVSVGVSEIDWRALGWTITAQKVADEDELEVFIQDQYGEGCMLGDQIESAQPGVYDVKVAYSGDPEDGMEERAENDCLINYMYNIKYNPDTGVVVSWPTGQAYSFYSTLDMSSAYDEEMTDSFMFN